MSPRRIFVCPDADRPAETLGSRIVWLIAHDHRLSESMVEAVDYRGLDTDAVLSDLVDRTEPSRVEPRRDPYAKCDCRFHTEKRARS